MRKLNGLYLYSPSDLITFLECDYVSWLDRYDLDHPGELQRDPDAADDELFRSAGDAHEREHLASLIDSGRNVLDLKAARGSVAPTIQAMADGVDVIYQAYLEHAEFAGYSDFLVRVPGQSNFGSYQYEVLDTKLARSLKPYFAVQLCCYAEMLAAAQGVLPSHVGIVLGDGSTERLRVEDYWYYYRALKRELLEQQYRFDATMPPEIPPHGDFRHWTGYVSHLLEERDDLCRVAGIRSLQIKRLREVGITTVRELAASDAERVSRMAPATLQRLREQARLQLTSEETGKPAFVVLPPDPGQPRTGFATLPPASRNDVYFDMEGFPLIDGGLEYLFGASYQQGNSLEFSDWWAHDRREELDAFEGFVRWAHKRWLEDPAMHIYHYASYEKTALLKLMGRFGVCEAELDELLRNKIFVDLYTVVRQGLLIGEPSYSLKNVERLYLGKRGGAVATASDSIVYYHRWREQPDGREWNTSATLRLIRDYNRQDCDSTLSLAQWLRTIQAAEGLNYLDRGDRESKGPGEATNARATLAAEMVAEAESISDPERRRIHELLAWLLEFHRREQKPDWRALYERLDMNEQDLIENPDCLGGLELMGNPEPVKRSLRYRYRFDSHQETKLREGKTCCFAHDVEIKVDLESIDLDNGTLIFTMGNTRPPPPRRLNLIPYNFVPPKAIVDSIERLVRHYRSGDPLPSALSNFLGRHAPKLKGRGSGSVAKRGVSMLIASIDAALALDQSTLVVQGPPGSGKTFTAARMIAALVDSGHRVGVTSNSHRAISLLLQETAKACREQHIPFSGASVAGQDDDGSGVDGFEPFAKGKELFEQDCLQKIVGGTAWVFSLAEAAGKFDYLFVDEAGQVSLANLVGMAASTRNIVIFGDQRQLNQPMHGSHPGESGSSILEYRLGETATVPAEMGIFLPDTWRMHPKLCSFISDAVYEGKLGPVELTSLRRLVPNGDSTHWISRTEGVVYVPVKHEGNVYESEEEADVITEIVAELLGHGFDDGDGRVRPMSTSDILIVCPFNLQVRLLRRSLPTVRIGTVDKFQGQEAPVVIYSMTSSTGDASPRGLSFLFNPNRLNVALSRAQVLAVLVGSPELERTGCQTLPQMRLVNLFCRATEAGMGGIAVAGKGA